MSNELRWAVVPVTLPAAEPVSLTEAKLALRIDVDAEDALTRGYLAGARQYVEGIQQRIACLTTFDLLMDRWPSGGEIALPRAPLRSVASVTYVDAGGDTQTVSADDYHVETETEPGLIALKSGKTWPSASMRPGMPIRIRFQAGSATPFTATANTDTLTARGHPYSNGDAVRLTNSGGALPAGLAADTDYYVINATANTLQLAATAGGDAIDITGTGTGLHYLGAVPRTMINAILLLAGHWHEHRTAAGEPRATTEVPLAFQSLLDVGRLWCDGPGS